MNLLGPIALGTWTYIAIGAAVLAASAYIIKMRRRRFEVPFSHLWKRVLDQKDSNTLWKQLKRLLSLLLALLILGLVLFAALDPTLGGDTSQGKSVVILLDASASMKALDAGDASRAGPGPEARIEVAKQRAQAVVDSMGGADVAMIMKVDGQATPASRFSADIPMLRKQIAAITASDTPADLPRALAAAADALADRQHPLVILVSDGAYPEAQLGLVNWRKVTAPPAAGSGAAWDQQNLAAVNLADIDVRFIGVGSRSDNVGILAFNVRRYVANKAAYEVLIEVQNFGTEPAHRKLGLYNGDTAIDVMELTLAPGERTRKIYAELPATEEHRLRAVLSPVPAADGSVVADPFPLDDEAYALLPLRKKQKVLMVTDDNLYLEGAVLVYDNIEPSKITPAQYAADPTLARGFDSVIFDEYTPTVLPAPPTGLVFFHPTGAASPIKISGHVASPHITTVDEHHPVMTWVTLADVNFDQSEVFAPDRARGEFPLASSIGNTIIAGKRDHGQKMIAFGFSLPATGREGATDLPLRVAFPLLLVNTLDWFSGDDAELLTTYPTGQQQRVAIDGAGTLDAVTMTDPDGQATVIPTVDGLVPFYASRVGFHTVRLGATPAPAAPGVELAANLASAAESNIAPSATVTLGGKVLTAPEAFAISRSRKLWIYLVLLAGILIAIEWMTYHRRVTV